MTTRRDFHYALFLPFLFPAALALAARRFFTKDVDKWVIATLLIGLADIGLIAGAVHLKPKPPPPTVTGKKVIGVGAARGTFDDGLTLSRVTDGSPAASAGIRVGDRITAANGKPVRSVPDLAGLVSSATTSLRLEVVRDGEPFSVHVLPVDREALPPPPPDPIACAPEPPTANDVVPLVVVAVLMILLFGHARMTNAPYGGRWTLALVVFGAAIAASPLAGRVACSLSGDGPTTFFASLTSQQLVMCGGALLLVVIFRRQGVVTPFAEDRLPFGAALGRGAMYAMAGALRVGLLGVLLRSTATEPLPIESVATAPDTFTTGWLVFLAINAIVLAPLSEELLFRGVVLPGLLQQMRPLFAILVTAVLFGVPHFVTHGAGAIVPCFLGIVLGWQRWRTGSLAAPIALHAAINAFGVITSWLR